MTKIVINDCYGGFGLSPKAKALLYKRKTGKDCFTRYINKEYLEDKTVIHINTHDTKARGCPDEEVMFDYDIQEKEITVKNHNYTDKMNKWSRHLIDSSFEYKIKRHDKDLVELVEKLGKESWGDYAELKVVTIEEDKYIITEYDGWETIETPSSIKWITIGAE